MILVASPETLVRAEARRNRYSILLSSLAVVLAVVIILVVKPRADEVDRIRREAEENARHTGTAVAPIDTTIYVVYGLLGGILALSLVLGIIFRFKGRDIVKWYARSMNLKDAATVISEIIGPEQEKIAAKYLEVAKVTDEIQRLRDRSDEAVHLLEETKAEYAQVMDAIERTYRRYVPVDAPALTAENRTKLELATDALARIGGELERSRDLAQTYVREIEMFDQRLELLAAENTPLRFVKTYGHAELRALQSETARMRVLLEQIHALSGTSTDALDRVHANLAAAIERLQRADTATAADDALKEFRRARDAWTTEVRLKQTDISRVTADIERASLRARKLQEAIKHLDEQPPGTKGTYLKGAEFQGVLQEVHESAAELREHAAAAVGRTISVDLNLKDVEDHLENVSRSSTELVAASADVARLATEAERGLRTTIAKAEATRVEREALFTALLSVTPNIDRADPGSAHLVQDIRDALTEGLTFALRKDDFLFDVMRETPTALRNVLEMHEPITEWYSSVMRSAFLAATNEEDRAAGNTVANISAIFANVDGHLEATVRIARNVRGEHGDTYREDFVRVPFVPTAGSEG